MSRFCFSTTTFLDKTTNINLRNATARVRVDGTRCGAFIGVLTDLRLTLTETVDASTMENCGRKAVLFVYLERANDTVATEFQIYNEGAISRLFMAATHQCINMVMEVLCEEDTQLSFDCNGTVGDDLLFEAFTDGCKSYANQLRMDREKASKRAAKKGGVA